MDLAVSEMYHHPEENNGVIWGLFFFFFFLLARGSDGFVFLALHLSILMF